MECGVTASLTLTFLKVTVHINSFPVTGVMFGRRRSIHLLKEYWMPGSKQGKDEAEASDMSENVIIQHYKANKLKLPNVTK